MNVVLSDLIKSKLLIEKNEINRQLRIRLCPHVSEKIEPILLDKYLNDGWCVEKELKSAIRVKKQKNVDISFEDRVWCLLAKMGYAYLNKDRLFKLPYGVLAEEQKQIDVFAKDDDTILVIECKATNKWKTANFKEEIESYKGIIDGLIKTIKEVFNDKKYKIKFIFATSNYELSSEDIKRLDAIHGIHLTDENIKYFERLYTQLGTACKYQFLGYIFDGQEIPSLDNKVPAVRGKMGGHTYYSFAIEPAKLLKIGYVLHRNKANINMMPTYQRLIKKKRLAQVRQFIEVEKGYFPNSVVVNIDDSSCRFEKANTQVESTISDVGILYLPKRYKSIYIIDGQHRLYGYSGCEYANTNTIPVVAFVNLKREEQVNLFMQINENQKAVSKNLRETLNGDLCWTSSDYKKQQDALCSRIATFLGESPTSPLYNQVSIGEDEKVIAMSYIKSAIKKSQFLGEVTSKSIVQLGLVYNGNLDESYEKLTSLLIKSLKYLRENTDEEKEDAANGLVFMNSRGIYGFIRVLSDILQFIQDKGYIKEIKKTSVNDIFTEIKQYITPIAIALNTVSDEIKIGLKKSYGSGEERKYWRYFQTVVRNSYEEFNPQGLDDYIASISKDNVDKAFSIIREIESFFKEDAKIRLISKYGELKWFEKGVPPKFAKDAMALAFDKNRELNDGDTPCEAWDCLTIIAYKEIALNNWNDLFDKAYTAPWQKGGNKQQKTEWMQQIERIRNTCFHSYTVSKEDLELLEQVSKWLLKK